jgi:hypothetical protein
MTMSGGNPVYPADPAVCPPPRSTSEGRQSPEGDGTLALELESRPVASYVWRPEMPIGLAPRPYLHPVQTLAGTVVTDLMPASHRHHLGISIAVPDVHGRNFWGGRSFIPGHGPAWLDNHGIQRHERWLQCTSTEISHTLRWVTMDGSVLMGEQRTITCHPVSATAWALDLSFHLHNASGEPLVLRSPANQGRAGAGYAGFFWRAPAMSQRVRVFGESGQGIEALHGARAEWMAVSAVAAPIAPQDRHREWSLIFVAADELTRGDRWFVRARDHVAVGSSLTWDEPLTLAPGEGIARNIVTIIADGLVAPDEAASLVGGIRSGLPAGNAGH